MTQPNQPPNTPALNHKIKSIENYGRMYIFEILAEDRRRLSNIMDNSLAALSFFYGKVFMRCRKDILSVKFMKRAMEVLQEYSSIHDINLSTLKDELVLHHVNNHNDQRMVEESVHFIRDNLKGYGYNIFNWSVDTIQTNNCSEAYSVLTGIHAIGDKLATFYLRDVALVSELEPTILPENYKYFQPIDTWVKQVTDAIGITETADREVPGVKEKIISCCIEAKVSPLLFNAGAWMIGANAFRLIIKLL